MRGEEGVWRANLRVIGRLLVAPLVFCLVAIYCLMMMAFYAFVVWPLTGKTVVKVGWEGADESTRRRIFTPTRD